jgi:hypothetical protein
VKAKIIIHDVDEGMVEWVVMAIHKTLEEEAPNLEWNSKTVKHNINPNIITAVEFKRNDS